MITSDLILVCKCGWYGDWDDQDALGSKCGCCPDCGNEELVWLNKLQERIKELEGQLDAARDILWGKTKKADILKKYKQRIKGLEECLLEKVLLKTADVIACERSRGYVSTHIIDMIDDIRNDVEQALRGGEA